LENDLMKFKEKHQDANEVKEYETFINIKTEELKFVYHIKMVIAVHMNQIHESKMIDKENFRNANFNELSTVKSTNEAIASSNKCISEIDSKLIQLQNELKAEDNEKIIKF